MKFKIAFLLSLVGYLAVAQQDDKAKQKALTASKDLTWEGNKQLSEDNFAEAEVDYRKAIAKSDENVAARYNLGNAYYNNETYSEAFGRFKQAGELASDKSDKHVAYHNMGNVFMKRKDYQKAVEAYKEALRSDPTDDETRYNLALAKEMLKKEQQQNKDNKDEKDKKDQSEDKKEGDNEDKNKDQDKKDQGDKGDKGDQNEEKKDENKQGEGDQKKEQNKKPEQGDQQEQEQPQQRRPNQLSKQQVQNLLEAMQNEEKKVQEKMDAQKVKGAKVSTEKDW